MNKDLTTDNKKPCSVLSTAKLSQVEDKTISRIKKDLTEREKFSYRFKIHYQDLLSTITKGEKLREKERQKREEKEIKKEEVEEEEVKMNGIDGDCDVDQCLINSLISPDDNDRKYNSDEYDIDGILYIIGSSSSVSSSSSSISGCVSSSSRSSGSGSSGSSSSNDTVLLHTETSSDKILSKQKDLFQSAKHLIQSRLCNALRHIAKTIDRKEKFLDKKKSYQIRAHNDDSNSNNNHNNNNDNNNNINSNNNDSNNNNNYDHKHINDNYNNCYHNHNGDRFDSDADTKADKVELEILELLSPNSDENRLFITWKMKILKTLRTDKHLRCDEVSFCVDVEMLKDEVLIYEDINSILFLTVRNCMKRSFEEPELLISDEKCRRNFVSESESEDNEKLKIYFDILQSEIFRINRRYARLLFQFLKTSCFNLLKHLILNFIILAFKTSLTCDARRLLDAD